MIDIDKLLATPGTLTGGRTYEQVLIATRARLDRPERWTQQAFARLPNGVDCKPRNPGACCWCLLGAVAYESNPYGIIPPPLLEFLGKLQEYSYPKHSTPRFSSVSAMNDYVSHAEVLRFLDLALEQFPK